MIVSIDHGRHRVTVDIPHLHDDTNCIYNNVHVVLYVEVL